MTEAEWLACTTPDPMLESLYSKKRNERNLRLFACACCRRIWYLFDARSRDYIEILEHYLDGLADSNEIVRAARLHDNIFQELNLDTPEHIAAAIVNQISPHPGTPWTLMWKAVPEAWALARNAVSEVRRALLLRSPQFDNSLECKAQAALLREIIGNPFSPATIDPAALRWQDAIVPKLAQGLYDQLDFDRLPILADALEEAACTNADILNHCRQPGEHVRGCWVIDLLLGKE